MLSRFQGCILGGMCGDVLGAAVEGSSTERIQTIFPNGLTEFCKYGPRPYGHYTDDSQMTLALMKSLIRMKGNCDIVDCAKSYATDFQVHRGYGSTAFKILAELRIDGNPHTIANKYIPEGSWANGGAMRIAPIGLLYANKPINEFKEAVKNAIHCTHTHLHAIDGAFIQAIAVSYLANTTQDQFDPNVFLEHLEELADTTELKEKIR